MALRLLMGTQPRVSTPGRPWRAAAILLALAAGVACGGTANNAAGHSPSSLPGSPTPNTSPTAQASSTAGPQPVTGAYGVLVSSQSASSYTVALVAVDGKVAASGETSTPAGVSCANAAGAPVPEPVSTSNSRAYFMDAQGVVRFIAPNGDAGSATTVPAGTASRRSMFAVSPDDQRIAVVVVDYNASGAATKLYVEDLNGGGHRVDLFSETGARTLWPIGWHGTNNLVVAVAPSCTQGGGPFCCGPQELHVVDPATAARRFTLGDVTSCPIVGSASPAGVICWDGTQSKVLNWTAGNIRGYPQQGPALQFLSPNGNLVAVVTNGGTTMRGSSAAFTSLFACGWIDDTHILAGGDSQHQPRVADTSTGNQIPIPAQGDCAGRLPGGL